MRLAYSLDDSGREVRNGEASHIRRYGVLSAHSARGARGARPSVFHHRRLVRAAQSVLDAFPWHA